MRYLTITLLLVTFAGCGDTASPTPTKTVASSTDTSLTKTATPNPMSDTDKPWRTDPALTGKFHPDYPDDMQVIVHEGGPRLTEKQPELVWVHVTGKQGDAYQGTLLNQPQQLPSLKQDDTILFMVGNVGNEAFMVTEKYVQERRDWHIGPCNKCGMPELFDAPSDLQAKVFPDIPKDARIETFTSFCPLCGGVQIVSATPIEDQP